MMHELAPEIATFVKVVERGSFSAVATEKGQTSSGVSRTISRLEHHLGTKLLFRTTRQLALTPEGETFLAHARSILDALDLASSKLAETTNKPRGCIRVNCGTAFANHKLAPIAAEFAGLYPDVSLDISVTDQRIDPVIRQADVTIRVGELTDSDLIAIPLGNVARVIAASPGYLKRCGTPRSPEDLLEHNCLLLTGFPHQANWTFHNKGKPYKVSVKGSFSADSADTLLKAALAGAGIVRLGDFLGAEALEAGQLVPLLTESHATDSQHINALVQPGRQAVPRIRALLDFLKARATK